jgi:hypothetical protein
MEQISMKALTELINRPEVQEIVDITSEFSKSYEHLYEVENKVINNFNLIVQFLVKNPDKEIKIFIERDMTASVLGPIPSNIASILHLPAQTTPHKEMWLSVNKDGFGLVDTSSIWGGMGRFEDFTPTEGIKSKYTSFLKTIFGYPNVYEQLYPKLSENGKELFSKLKDKYNSLYFNQVTNKWANYKIGPLNEDEKKMFNYITDNASLTFHTRQNGITIFIGNDRSPKGTPRPSFDNNIFNKNQHDKQQFVYEKIFIINHFDDIKRGIENYKKYEFININLHLEFIKEINELISKYVILKKL